MQTGKLDDLLAGAAEVELRLGALTPAVQAGVSRFGSCESLADGRLRVRLAGEEQIPALVGWLAAEGVSIYSVVPQRASLEEFFVRVMEGEEAG